MRIKYNDYDEKVILLKSIVIPKPLITLEGDREASVSN